MEMLTYEHSISIKPKNDVPIGTFALKSGMSNKN